MSSVFPYSLMFPASRRQFAARAFAFSLWVSVSALPIARLRAQELPPLSSSSESSAGVAPVEYDSLLDSPSLIEEDLPEDPANPFGLAPIQAATAVPVSDSPFPEESPAANAIREREEYLAAFAVNNALTRTALQNRRSTGDRFLDGFGGVPNPMNSPLAPKVRPGEFLLHLGPIKLTPSLGASYSKSFGSSSAASSSFGNTGVSIPGSGRSGSDPDGSFGSVIAGVIAEIGESALGRFITLDYGAALNFGSGSGAGDSPDQTLTLLGQLDFVRLKFGLGVSFDSLSGNDREFGRDIQRDLATVSLTTSYIHSPKTSVDLDLSMPLSQYDGGIDSTSFAATTSVNYHYSTKTTFGLGFTTGITSVSGGSSVSRVSGGTRSDSQTYQQVNARMASTASPFISYSGTAGFEWRDTGDTQSTSPIFGLGVIWTPRVGTSLSLTVDQQVQNSAAIVDANFTSTSIALTATQRLGSLASLGASIGYEHASYDSTSSDQSVSRRDRTYFAQASLSRTFFRRVSLTGAVSYFHTESNDLPQQATQISVSATYTF